MEDAEHRRMRIQYVHKKQKELEAERIRLVKKLRRHCLHTNFITAIDNRLDFTWRVHLCTDCGFEEANNLWYRSPVFTGNPCSEIDILCLKEYRTDYLQVPTIIE